MAKAIPQQKIDDCRGLYLKYGGGKHDRIVAEMRALGWTGFTDRNLYRRTRNGRTEPGWPERFGWDLPTKVTKKAETRPVGSVSPLHKPAREQGRYSRRKPKRSPAFGNRQASERTIIRPAALEAKPKFNRQKTRRLRREREHLMTQLHSIDSTNSTNSVNSANSANSANSPNSPNSSQTFHSWLNSLPSIWSWDYRHQLYLYEQLQKVTDGTTKRLMIFMPPRHGKSELVTVRYTAWRLKQDPSLNVIVGSYAQDLANRFSRKIKRVLIDDWAVKSGGVEESGSRGVQESKSGGVNERGVRREPMSTRHNSSTPPPDHPSTSSPFPFTRTRLVNRVSEWETTKGGGLRAVGVGAGVTGYGADLIVIDDPVKSREQANSRRFRDKVWEWYNDDLRTRLEPGGTIILIQTRWHQDDLAGRLLEQEDGEQWTVVNLPALAEAAVKNDECRLMNDEIKNGEPSEYSSFINHHSSFEPDWRSPGTALWPERFDVAALEDVRKRQGELTFASLYQQRPVPIEGGVFKREWFTHIVEYAPPGLDWKRGYDLAVSTSDTADYTATFRVAYDAEGNLYIADGIRRRIGFPEQRRLMYNLIMREKDTEHGIERALHGEAIMQDLRREARLRGKRFVGINVRHDKHTRSLKWQSLAADGRLRLVRGPWNRDFIEEICTFPQARHDDQLDAVSLAVAMHDKKAGKLYVF